MTKKIEEPKDLGVKIASKDMAFWDKTIKETEEIMIASRNNIKIQQAVLDVAKRHYEEEKAKFEGSEEKQTYVG